MSSHHQVDCLMTCRPEYYTGCYTYGGIFGIVPYLLSLIKLILQHWLQTLQIVWLHRLQVNFSRNPCAFSHSVVLSIDAINSLSFCHYSCQSQRERLLSPYNKLLVHCWTADSLNCGMPRIDRSLSRISGVLGRRACLHSGDQDRA